MPKQQIASHIFDPLERGREGENPSQQEHCHPLRLCGHRQVARTGMDARGRRTQTGSSKGKLSRIYSTPHILVVGGLNYSELI